MARDGALTLTDEIGVLREVKPKTKDENRDLLLIIIDRLREIDNACESGLLSAENRLRVVRGKCKDLSCLIEIRRQ